MDQQLWRTYSLYPQLTPARATSLFENTMVSPFFYFLNTDRGGCVFSVWPLHKVENWFRKQLWNKNVHIFILIFFASILSVFKEVKNGFPIIFSKSDVALAGVNCGDRLWLLQISWSIFYGKITGTFKILILYTLVIYQAPLSSLVNKQVDFN